MNLQVDSETPTLTKVTWVPASAVLTAHHHARHISGTLTEALNKRCNRIPKLKVNPGHQPNTGVLTIRIGLWGILSHKFNKEPPHNSIDSSSIGN